MHKMREIIFSHQNGNQGVRLIDNRPIGELKKNICIYEYHSFICEVRALHAMMDGVDLGMACSNPHKSLDCVFGQNCVLRGFPQDNKISLIKARKGRERPRLARVSNRKIN